MGGLGSSPKADILVDIKFWSDLHVRNEWPAGGFDCRAVLGANGGAPSHDVDTGEVTDAGDLGSMS
jgi:hypothetical protein